MFSKYAEAGGTLSLNELGDFLAGLAGPVALLWLVVGFFQQGAAITVQSGELKAAVLQHKAQVDATNKMADQETRKTRIEYYKLVSETSHVIGDCRSELGLENRNISALNRLLGIGLSEEIYEGLFAANAVGVLASNTPKHAKRELRNRYEELFSRHQTAQNNLDDTAAVSLEKLEILFKSAVALHGEAHLLLKNIKDYNRKDEKRPVKVGPSTKELKSTLDQSPL
ncbi:hypothetical protein K3555_06740 [Leisingera sp. M527]|uniref:hypothetical protein n=1 Tax=Leisingera sp. M527 TaxID=2867014 RepID=UPI0021A8BA8D|nr:hypothetical protein [Leisingera sp. M527]UWQ34189.1 hypothetical protein K3555_06740 [Leisingera sp. M527]